MQLDNDADTEPTLYAATLAPHRSLDERGFLIVMVFVAVVSFVCGVAFMLMGAWPVFGFFGLDVLLIWGAFRMNFRAAKAREEIRLTPSHLRVRKISPEGRAQVTDLNPLWTRLDTEVHEEWGILRLNLISRGTPTEVGSFLPPVQKAQLARELAIALADAKKGIVRSAV